MATTSTALLWNMLRVLGQSGLGILVSIVLARLLTPEAFGVMAIAMIFITFSEMVTSVGLSLSVVQRPDLSERHIQTGISLSFIAATLFFAMFWFLAEPAAEFFNEPIVVDVVHVLSLSAWISTAGSVNRGLLMREMNFRELMKIDLICYALGYALFSTLLAILGFGVWSLVIGTIASQTMITLWLWKASKVRYRFSLHAQECKELFGFGAGISLNNTIGFISHNTTQTIIGRLMDTATLGVFNRAATTAHIPFIKIATTISGVMMSSYSKVQNDIPELKRQYLKAVKLVSSLSVPILMGLYVCGEYVILGMYGDQWKGAVEVFKILCLAGVLNNILHLAGAVVQSTGQIFREVKRQAFVATLTIIVIYWAAQISIEAVAWAYTFTALVLYLLMAQLSLGIVGGTWKEYFEAQLPAISVSLPVVVLDYAVIQVLTHFDVSPVPGLLLLIASSGAAYAGCLLFAPDRWIGGVRGWILERYGARIPNKFMKLISR